MGVNHPGSQEDLVSNREPAHRLMEDAGLWGRDCPLPALAVARLPLASGRGWASLQPASSPLVFAQSFVM